MPLDSQWSRISIFMFVVNDVGRVYAMGRGYFMTSLPKEAAHHLALS